MPLKNPYNHVSLNCLDVLEVLYAILDAQPDDQSLVPNAPSLGTVLKDFLYSIDADFTAQVFLSATGELPEPEDFDAYVIGGSTADAFDSETLWIASLRNFVRAAYSLNKKLVGICFGHQLLAQALGGRANRSPGGWSAGTRAYELLENALPWQVPALTECTLHALHADQVLELPPDTKVLARSEHCPNGMILIGDTALGIQGHPEFSAEFMRAVLMEAPEPLPEALRTRALNELNSQTVHDTEIGQWIINFLNMDNPVSVDYSL